MRLRDKVAIITGSTSGIGADVAQLFAEEGAKVIVSGRSTSRGEEVVRAIGRAGGEATFVRSDVSRTSDVRNLVRQSLEAWGKIDILVNNAAHNVHQRKPGADYSEAEWDQEVDVTLRGAFLCCKYAIPEMLKTGGGSIVNVSSTSGILGDRGLAAYDSAKGGMNMLTRALAIDYGPSGIRVNAVCPGAVDTPMAAYVKADAEKYQHSVSRIVLGRWATTREIAHCVLFLASDEASYVTGAYLVVDGGWTIQH